MLLQGSTRRWCVIACLVAITVSRLPAQTIRGELVERVGQIPLSGAQVALIDEQGREISRAVTDHDGAFVFALPGPGIYRLRAKRVGFRQHLSPALTAAADQVLHHRLEIEPLAIDLAAVVVEGERQCDLTTGRSAKAVAALWEELREALSAVSWSARDPGYWFELAMFERDLTAGGRVQHEAKRVEAGQFRHSFQSPPIAALIESGFVASESRSWVFSAPDADVLLSDQFLTTHCFDSRVGRGATAGLLGLGFSPVEGRRVPEVRGVLWIDRASAELRYLEFSYVSLPGPLFGTRAGGRVSFRRVPSGTWIVQDWTIRMPLLSSQESSAFRDVGGDVLRITGPDRDVIYSQPLAVVQGSVFDSTTGRVAIGARVSLAETPYAVRSDSGGAFRLIVPLAGSQRLTFTHPRADSLGLVAAETRVELNPERPAHVSLTLPSEATVVDRLCDRPVRPEERVVIGVARDRRSGLPARGAAIGLSWQVVRTAGGRATNVTVHTDDRGWFAACGLPLGRPIVLTYGVEASVTLTFAQDGVTVGTGVLQPFSGRIWRQDVEVP